MLFPNPKRFDIPSSPTHRLTVFYCLSFSLSLSHFSFSISHIFNFFLSLSLPFFILKITSLVLLCSFAMFAHHLCFHFSLSLSHSLKILPDIACNTPSFIFILSHILIASTSPQVSVLSSLIATGNCGSEFFHFSTQSCCRHPR